MGARRSCGQCFYVFSNCPGDLKPLSSAGRQAEEYIAPGGKFFMFFYVSKFAYELGKYLYGTSFSDSA